MSTNVRQMFFTKLRNDFYNRLLHQELAGWQPNIVTTIVDEAINANMANINNYLQNNEVMLLDMGAHVNQIIEQFLLPYLGTKRVL
jgi:hypothetical protein